MRPAITHEYVCDAGHAIGANAPITACPAWVHGRPCEGAITRVGHGSRTKAA